jgi:hypothetical protein
MRTSALIFCLAVIAIVSQSASCFGQAATADSRVQQLENNANLAFDRQQYTVALASFQKLLTMLPKDSPRIGSIDEKIRVCQKALSAGPAPANPLLQLSTDTMVSSTGAQQRTPHVRPKNGEVLNATIKELGNFDYNAEKGGNLPADVRQLNGVKVRTSGFMMPLVQAGDITEFALVPSLFSCCFGQPPQVQHTIIVHAPEGKALSYYPDELIVEGSLLVEERMEDGIVVSLFEVNCTSVRAAPKEP